jgi:hypothetical protein
MVKSFSMMNLAVPGNLSLTGLGNALPPKVRGGWAKLVSFANGGLAPDQLRRGLAANVKVSC